jgi:hypothetical protein
MSEFASGVTDGFSVDAERIDTRRDDGSPSSRWEDAWCNFVDEDTGEALRMRLDDQDWH